MNLKLGDFVRFVDENLEGYITRIIDKDTVGVTDANDFEIPVLASKVTLVHADAHEGTANTNTANIQSTAISSEFIEKGVYLALITDQHSPSVVHFQLVNESSYQLLISFTTEKNGDFKGEAATIVAPHSVKKIYSAQLSDIQLWPKYRLEILYHTSTNREPKMPVIYHQNIRGKDLSVAKQEIAPLKQKGWLIKLEEDESGFDMEKLKERFS